MTDRCSGRPGAVTSNVAMGCAVVRIAQLVCSAPGPKTFRVPVVNCTPSTWNVTAPLRLVASTRSWPWPATVSWPAAAKPTVIGLPAIRTAAARLRQNSFRIRRWYRIKAGRVDDTASCSLFGPPPPPGRDEAAAGLRMSVRMLQLRPHALAGSNQEYTLIALRDREVCDTRISAKFNIYARRRRCSRRAADVASRERSDDLPDQRCVRTGTGRRPQRPDVCAFAHTAESRSYAPQ